MKLPVIDNIWRARGDIPLDPGLSAEEVFARLDPLLQAQGTTYTVAGDTLTYTKHNPAAQDKLATFTNGKLQVERHGGGAVLRFDLGSPALLACFLAPLLFLGFAQLAVTINALEKPAIEASEKAEKDKPKPPKPLNPVDEFLGAPAPEDPTKKKDKDEDKDEGQHSPTPGYVLAGLFFVTYLVGRWLEPWLVRRRFRAALAGQGDMVAQTNAQGPTPAA